MNPAVLAISFLLLQARVNQEIVVTASAVPETVESTPASVTVITKKEIEQRKARDVGDVLRDVPGLTVSQTGSAGKIESVFIRGASSKQTLVLWNGIEINDPYFSGYNWGQFSTAGVERVEVARGPFSSLYGADAVGGVVNIITTGGENRLEADLAAGGRGLVNGVISTSQTRGADSFYATAEHRQDNGFAPNDNAIQKTMIGGWTRAEGAFSVGLAARYMNYNLGVPTNANATFTAFIPTLHHRENGNEWQLAVPATLQLSALHLDARVAESRRDDNNDDPDSSTFGRTRSARQNTRVVARTSTAIGTIAGGIEAERDKAMNNDSFGLDLAEHHRTSNALFIEDRFGRALADGQLELSTGVRHDRYTTFGSETSPRAAIAWSAGGNKFRVAYGEAFRAPQIGELYLPFFGNPDLRAERSRSAEIGYERFVESGSNASVTLFDNRFRNLIVYDNAAFRFGNIGEAHTRGAELAASRKAGAWSVDANYTYLSATEEPSGKPLPRRPKHSGTVVLGYRAGTANMQFVLAHVGSRADVTDLFPFGDVTGRAYTSADVAVRWSAGAFAPYAKIENLTNTKYEEVFGYPSPTRRALVGVRYAR